ncbi:MAG: hypothetical protein ACSHW1_02020 [Yoonia sp.]|uniref:hypothetical protein n=1 Tax=Yoonia sp. TaxID=2212373 RepID=UPI003EF84AB0
MKTALVILQLLPENIDLSQTYQIRSSLRKFGFEKFKDAMKRFESAGHPDGRYSETELRIQPYDLQKLDYMVYNLRRICYPLLDNQDVILKIKADSKYSANSDICLISQDRLGSVTRETAISRDNVSFFPNIAKEAKGTYKIQLEMRPSFLAHISKRLSDADKEWLREMTRESFD